MVVTRKHNIGVIGKDLASRNSQNTTVLVVLHPIQRYLNVVFRTCRGWQREKFDIMHVFSPLAGPAPILKVCFLCPVQPGSNEVQLVIGPEETDYLFKLCLK